MWEFYSRFCCLMFYSEIKAFMKSIKIFFFTEFIEIKKQTCFKYGTKFSEKAYSPLTKKYLSVKC